MPNSQDPNDIPGKSWINRLLPPRARAYARLMRLDRPIGTWLLLLPGWWAITLAGFGLPKFGATLEFDRFWNQNEIKFGLLFLVGALVMRGAGCTYNDIVDRDIDAKVARTRTRPLASGEISVRAAWIFLGLQLAVGLLVLAQLRMFAVYLGIASLVLVFTYPFMKRLTYWPQAWLGLTFNWGALMGWGAMRGNLDRPSLLLYASGFFWTLGYDTVYAHQDKEDDALVGVKSSALALGDKTRSFVAASYLATMLMLLLALRPMPLGWPTRIFLIAAAGQLAWQVVTLKTDDPANCLKRFRSNRDFGLLILAALLLIRY
jgi:4-hydroxybenzoate polyprenyltransferase